MGAHKAAEVERVQMAVPAAESSWLLDVVALGEQLCSEMDLKGVLVA